MQCSEFVSLGHPDKTADYIASRLLDEYLVRDPKSRFAMEALVKDNTVVLAGEVTSQWKPSGDKILEIVRSAVREIGYTHEYASRWPSGATMDADLVQVESHIGMQSPDIGRGVDADGWGDQGCFTGLATHESEYGYMPRDVWFAQKIGRTIYNAAKEGRIPAGLDIKTLVALGEGKLAERVIVAVPTLPENAARVKGWVMGVVKNTLAYHGYMCGETIVNGTGAYVVHSSVGDTGVVGRKLAVDFYGTNCPVGGGCPWAKDPTKADVTLNIAARVLSVATAIFEPSHKKVFTDISCCIGRKECLVSQKDENGEKINGRLIPADGHVVLQPSQIVDALGLREKGVFSKMCANGLFSEADKIGKQAKRMSGIWP